MIQHALAKREQSYENGTAGNTGIGGIILAGGRSSRMNGEMKSLLPLAGMPVIKRIAVEMSRLCQSVTVAAAYEHQAQHYSRLGLSVALDEAPDCGPLVAFYSALQKREEELVWLSACDMPLVSAKSAEWMVQQLKVSGAMAVIPEIGGKLHPLQAIYRKESINLLAPLVAAGERRMGVLMQRLEPLIVTEQAFCEAGIALDFVYNMNTPEQYEHLQQSFSVREEARSLPVGEEARQYG